MLDLCAVGLCRVEYGGDATWVEVKEYLNMVG